MRVNPPFGCQSWCSRSNLEINNFPKLADFMDNWHYPDPNYTVSHGIRVILRHIIMWHIHLCHDIFRLMVGQLTKHPYFIYREYKKNNIQLITEEGTIAIVHGFMCGYLTRMRGHISPRNSIVFCHPV
uniref:Uncharacterized protein n=1 Tax=Romanomermis culicivorax TaxID=13658 RepID=A0A915HU15_ROMCU